MKDCDYVLVDVSSLVIIVAIRAVEVQEIKDFLSSDITISFRVQGEQQSEEDKHDEF